MNQIDINESGLRAVDEAVFGEWPRQESSLVIAARAAGSAADVTAVAPEAVAMSDEALRAEWAGLVRAAARILDARNLLCLPARARERPGEDPGQAYAAQIESAETTHEGLMVEWGCTRRCGQNSARPEAMPPS